MAVEAAKVVFFGALLSLVTWLVAAMAFGLSHNQLVGCAATAVIIAGGGATLVFQGRIRVGHHPLRTPHRLWMWVVAFAMPATFTAASIAEALAARHLPVTGSPASLIDAEPA